MTTLTDLKAAVLASLTVAQTVQGQVNDVVAKHNALIIDIEKAEAVVPTMADVADIVSRAMAGAAKT